MLAGAEEILNLIPQKPPIVMVDTLLEQNDQFTVSSLKLTKENIFCQNGCFSETGMIENMAQTAALRSGFQAHINGKQPAIGFIGSLKQFVFYDLPSDHDILQTTITVQNELMQALIVHGEVKAEGKIMAEGEMTIFIQK